MKIAIILFIFHIVLTFIAVRFVRKLSIEVYKNASMNDVSRKEIAHKNIRRFYIIAFIPIINVVLILLWMKVNSDLT